MPKAPANGTASVRGGKKNIQTRKTQTTARVIGGRSTKKNTRNRRVGINATRMKKKKKKNTKQTGGGPTSGRKLDKNKPPAQKNSARTDRNMPKKKRKETDRGEITPNKENRTPSRAGYSTSSREAVGRGEGRKNQKKNSPKSHV